MVTHSIPLHSFLFSFITAPRIKDSSRSRDIIDSLSATLREVRQHCFTEISARRKVQESGRDGSNEKRWIGLERIEGKIANSGFNRLLHDICVESAVWVVDHQRQWVRGGNELL